MRWCAECAHVRAHLKIYMFQNDARERVAFKPLFVYIGERVQAHARVENTATTQDMRGG